MEIQQGMYGLPQAGILANQLLHDQLQPHGYYEVPHTPGLWKHTHRPIQLSLVVDDFGVKYTNKDNIEYLLNVLKQHYDMSEDWEGNLYCVITLHWYYNKQILKISMLGYVSQQLTKYKHNQLKNPVDTPLIPKP